MVCSCVACDCVASVSVYAGTAISPVLCFLPRVGSLPWAGVASCAVEQMDERGPQSGCSRAGGCCWGPEPSAQARLCFISEQGPRGRHPTGRLHQGLPMSHISAWPCRGCAPGSPVPARFPPEPAGGPEALSAQSWAQAPAQGHAQHCSGQLRSPHAPGPCSPSWDSWAFPPTAPLQLSKPLCLSLYTYLLVYTHTHTCLCTNIPVYAHTCLCTRIHVHAYMPAHLSTHPYLPSLHNTPQSPTGHSQLTAPPQVIPPHILPSSRGGGEGPLGDGSATGAPR